MHVPKSVLIDAVVATAFMWINKRILGSHQNQLFVNFFLIFLNPNIFPDTDSYHCKCKSPANEVIGGDFGWVCSGGKRVPSSVGVMKKLENVLFTCK